MIRTERWQLAGVNDALILGDADLPIGEPRGVALLCHGYKGYKDYGFFPLLGRRMAEAGLLALRFNFSHSGMTRQTDTFERPDLFEQDRFSYGVADTLAVAQAAASGAIPGSDLPQVWFGHSRGGFTCIHAAAQAFADDASQPEPTPRPSALILAAARDRPLPVSDEQRAAFERDGYRPETSSRTGQDLKIGIGYLHDIDAHPTGYDAVQAIANLPCPIQIIHGSGDQTVDVDSGRRLAKAAVNATYHEIPDASHTFDCPNPLAMGRKPPTHTETMIASAVEFAQQQLA